MAPPTPAIEIPRAACADERCNSSRAAEASSSGSGPMDGSPLPLTRRSGGANVISRLFGAAQGRRASKRPGGAPSSFSGELDADGAPLQPSSSAAVSPAAALRPRKLWRSASGAIDGRGVHIPRFGDRGLDSDAPLASPVTDPHNVTHGGRSTATESPRALLDRSALHASFDLGGPPGRCAFAGDADLNNGPSDGPQLREPALKTPPAADDADAVETTTAARARVAPLRSLLHRFRPTRGASTALHAPPPPPASQQQRGAARGTLEHGGSPPAAGHPARCPSPSSPAPLAAGNAHEAPPLLLLDDEPAATPVAAEPLTGASPSLWSSGHPSGARADGIALGSVGGPPSDDWFDAISGAGRGEGEAAAAAAADQQARAPLEQWARGIARDLHRATHRVSAVERSTIDAASIARGGDAAGSALDMERLQRARFVYATCLLRAATAGLSEFLERRFGGDVAARAACEAEDDEHPPLSWQILQDDAAVLVERRRSLGTEPDAVGRHHLPEQTALSGVPGTLLSISSPSELDCTLRKLRDCRDALQAHSYSLEEHPPGAESDLTAQLRSDLAQQLQQATAAVSVAIDAHTSACRLVHRFEAWRASLRATQRRLTEMEKACLSQLSRLLVIATLDDGDSRPPPPGEVPPEGRRRLGASECMALVRAQLAAAERARQAVAGAVRVGNAQVESLCGNAGAGGAAAVSTAQLSAISAELQAAVDSQARDSSRSVAANAIVGMQTVLDLIEQQHPPPSHTFPGAGLHPHTQRLFQPQPQPFSRSLPTLHSPGDARTPPRHGPSAASTPPPALATGQHPLASASPWGRQAASRDAGGAPSSSNAAGTGAVEGLRGVFGSGPEPPFPSRQFVTASATSFRGDRAWASHEGVRRRQRSSSGRAATDGGARHAPLDDPPHDISLPTPPSPFEAGHLPPAATPPPPTADDAAGVLMTPAQAFSNLFDSAYRLDSPASLELQRSQSGSDLAGSGRSRSTGTQTQSVLVVTRNAGEGGSESGIVLTFRTSDGPRAILNQLAAIMTLLGSMNSGGAPAENRAPRGATPEELGRLPVTVAEADGPEDELCPICYERIAAGDELCSLTCKHMMHKDHLHSALAVHAWCPICRTRMEGIQNEPAGCSIM